jgi:hypothetical protein
VNNFFKRALEVGLGNPSLNPRQRTAAAAEEISLAADLQAQVDVAEASIVALINVLYATAADGRPANYDEVTGRILIPVPWGSGGWRRWGLRKWEAVCLRKIMMARSKSRRPAPLFCYDKATRQWFVETEVYPDTESALRWLKDHTPNVAEWRQVTTDFRTQRVAH